MLPARIKRKLTERVLLLERFAHYLLFVLKDYRSYELMRRRDVGYVTSCPASEGASSSIDVGCEAEVVNERKNAHLLRA